MYLFDNFFLGEWRLCFFILWDFPYVLVLKFDVVSMSLCEGLCVGGWVGGGPYFDHVLCWVVAGLNNFNLYQF